LNPQILNPKIQKSKILLPLISRNKELFIEDIAKHEAELSETMQASRFLVIGGAGSNG
jgi:UDP-N-acetylglucosamine 4,6-dehydratase